MRVMHWSEPLNAPWQNSWRHSWKLRAACQSACFVFVALVLSRAEQVPTVNTTTVRVQAATTWSEIMFPVTFVCLHLLQGIDFGLFALHFCGLPPKPSIRSNILFDGVAPWVLDWPPASDLLFTPTPPAPPSNPPTLPHTPPTLCVFWVYKVFIVNNINMIYSTPAICLLIYRVGSTVQESCFPSVFVAAPHGQKTPEGSRAFPPTCYSNAFLSKQKQTKKNPNSLFDHLDNKKQNQQPCSTSEWSWQESFLLAAGSPEFELLTGGEGKVALGRSLVLVVGVSSAAAAAFNSWLLT